MMRKLFVLLVIHAGLVMVHLEKIESEDKSTHSNTSGPASDENLSSESTENVGVDKNLEKYLSGFVPSEITENWCPHECEEEGKVYENPNLSSYCTCERTGDELTTIRHNCSKNEMYNSTLGSCQKLDGNGYPICIIRNKQCPNNETGVRSHPNEDLYKNYIVCLNDKVIVGQCNVMMHYDVMEKRCVQDTVKKTILSYSDCEDAPKIDCKKPQVTLIEEYFKRQNNSTEIPDECRNCYYICSDRDVTSFDLIIECYSEHTQGISSAESTSWTYTTGYTNYTAHPISNEINSFSTPTTMEVFTDQVYVSSPSSATEQPLEIDYSSVLSSLHTFLTTSLYSESISEVIRLTTDNVLTEETTTSKTVEEIQGTEINLLTKNVNKDTILITTQATTVSVDTDKTLGTDKDDLRKETTKDPRILTNFKNTHSETEEVTTETIASRESGIAGIGPTTNRVFSEETTRGTVMEKTIATEIIDLTKETIKEPDITSTVLPVSYSQIKESSIGATTSNEIDTKVREHITGSGSAGETTARTGTNESGLIKESTKDPGIPTRHFSNPYSVTEEPATDNTILIGSVSPEIGETTESVLVEEITTNTAMENTQGTEVTNSTTVNESGYNSAVAVVIAPQDHSSVATEHTLLPESTIITGQMTGHVVAEETTANETTEVTPGIEINDSTRNNTQNEMKGSEMSTTVLPFSYFETKEPQTEAKVMIKVDSKGTGHTESVSSEKNTLDAMLTSETEDVGKSTGQTTETSLSDQTLIGTKTDSVTREIIQDSLVQTTGFSGIHSVTEESTTDLTKYNMKEPEISSTTLQLNYSKTEESRTTVELTNNIDSKGTGWTIESSLSEKTPLSTLSVRGTEDKHLDKETFQYSGISTTASASIYSTPEEPTIDTIKESGQSTTVFPFRYSETEESATTGRALNKIGSKATGQTTETSLADEPTGVVTALVIEADLTEQTVQNTGTATTDFPSTYSETKEPTTDTVRKLRPKTTTFSINYSERVKLPTEGTSLIQIGYEATQQSTEAIVTEDLTASVTEEIDLMEETVQDIKTATTDVPRISYETEELTTGTIIKSGPSAASFSFNSSKTKQPPTESPTLNKNSFKVTDKAAENILKEETTIDTITSSVSEMPTTGFSSIYSKTEEPIREGIESIYVGTTRKPPYEETALNHIGFKATDQPTNAILTETYTGTVIASVIEETDLREETVQDLGIETTEAILKEVSTGVITASVTGETGLLDATVQGHGIATTDFSTLYSDREEPTTYSTKQSGVTTIDYSFSYSVSKDPPTKGTALNQIGSKVTGHTTKAILTEEPTDDVTEMTYLTEEMVQDPGIDTTGATLTEEPTGAVTEEISSTTEKTVQDPETTTDFLSMHSDTKEPTTDTVRESRPTPFSISYYERHELPTKGISLNQIGSEVIGEPTEAIETEEPVEDRRTEETLQDLGTATTDVPGNNFKTDDPTTESGSSAASFSIISSETEEPPTESTTLNKSSFKATGQMAETILTEETTIGAIPDSVSAMSTTDFSSIYFKTDEPITEGMESTSVGTTKNPPSEGTASNHIGSKSTGPPTNDILTEESTGTETALVKEETDLTEETVQDTGTDTTKAILTEEPTDVLTDSVTDETDLTENTIYDPGRATIHFPTTYSDTEELTTDTVRESLMIITAFPFSYSETEGQSAEGTALNQIDSKATEQTTAILTAESIGAVTASVTEESDLTKATVQNPRTETKEYILIEESTSIVTASIPGETDLTEETFQDTGTATTCFSSMYSGREEPTTDTTKQSRLATTDDSFNYSEREKPPTEGTALNQIGTKATGHTTKAILTEESISAVTEMTYLTEETVKDPGTDRTDTILTEEPTGVVTDSVIDQTDLIEETVHDPGTSTTDFSIIESNTEEPTIYSVRESGIRITAISFSYSETEKPPAEGTAMNQIDSIATGQTTQAIMREDLIGAEIASITEKTDLTEETVQEIGTRTSFPDMYSDIDEPTTVTAKEPGLTTTNFSIGSTATRHVIEAIVTEESTDVGTSSAQGESHLRDETVQDLGVVTTDVSSIYSKTKEQTTDNVRELGLSTAISSFNNSETEEPLTESTAISKISFKATGQTEGTLIEETTMGAITTSVLGMTTIDFLSIYSEPEEPITEGMESISVETTRESPTEGTTLNQIGFKTTGHTTKSILTEEFRGAVTASVIQNLTDESVQNPGTALTDFSSVYSEREESTADTARESGLTTITFSVSYPERDELQKEGATLNQIGSKSTGQTTEAIAEEATVAVTAYLTDETDLTEETVQGLGTATRDIPSINFVTEGPTTNTVRESGLTTASFAFSNSEIEEPTTESTTLNGMTFEATGQTTKIIMIEESTIGATPNSVSGMSSTGVSGIYSESEESITDTMETTSVGTTRESPIEGTVFNQIGSKATGQTIISILTEEPRGTVTASVIEENDLTEERVQGPETVATEFPMMYSHTEESTTYIAKESELTTTDVSFNYYETKEPPTEGTTLNQINSKSTGQTTKASLTKESTGGVTTSVTEKIDLTEQTVQDTGITTTDFPDMYLNTEEPTTATVQESGLTTTEFLFNYSETEDLPTKATELNQIDSKVTRQTIEAIVTEESTAVRTTLVTEETDLTDDTVQDFGTESSGLTEEPIGAVTDVITDETNSTEQTVQDLGTATTNFPSIHFGKEGPTTNTVRESGLSAAFFSFSNTEIEEPPTESTTLNGMGFEAIGQTTENIITEESTIGTITASVSGMSTTGVLAIYSESEKPITDGMESISVETREPPTEGAALNQIGSKVTEQITKYIFTEKPTGAMTGSNHLTNEIVQNHGTAATDFPSVYSETEEPTTNTVRESGLITTTFLVSYAEREELQKEGTAVNQIGSKSTRQTTQASLTEEPTGAVTASVTDDTDLTERTVQDFGTATDVPIIYLETQEPTTNTVGESGLSATFFSFSNIEIEEPLTENTTLNGMSFEATGQTTENIMTEESNVHVITSLVTRMSTTGIYSELEEPLTNRKESISIGTIRMSPAEEIALNQIGSKATGHTTKSILTDEPTGAVTASVIEETDLTVEMVQDPGTVATELSIMYSDTEESTTYTAKESELKTTDISFSYSESEEPPTEGTSFNQIGFKVAEYTTKVISPEETKSTVINSVTEEIYLTKETVHDPGTATIEAILTEELTGVVSVTEKETTEASLTEESIDAVTAWVTVATDLTEETVQDLRIATTDGLRINFETEEPTTDIVKDSNTSDASFSFINSETEEASKSTTLNKLGFKATGQTENILTEETTIGVITASVSDMSTTGVSSIYSGTEKPITERMESTFIGTAREPPVEGTSLNGIGSKATYYTKKGILTSAVTVSEIEETDLTDETVQDFGIRATEFPTMYYDTKEPTTDTAKELGLTTTNFSFNYVKTKETPTEGTTLDQISSKATGQTKKNLTEEPTGAVTASLIEETNLTEEIVENPRTATTDFLSMYSGTEESIAETTKEDGLTTTDFSFNYSETEDHQAEGITLNQIGSRVTEQTTYILTKESTDVVTPPATEETVQDTGTATIDFSSVYSETEVPTTIAKGPTENVFATTEPTIVSTIAAETTATKATHQITEITHLVKASTKESEMLTSTLPFNSTDLNAGNINDIELTTILLTTDIEAEESATTVSRQYPGTKITVLADTYYKTGGPTTEDTALPSSISGAVGQTTVSSLVGETITSSTMEETSRRKLSDLTTIAGLTTMHLPFSYSLTDEPATIIRIDEVDLTKETIIDSTEPTTSATELRQRGTIITEQTTDSIFVEEIITGSTRENTKGTEITLEPSMGATSLNEINSEAIGQMTGSVSVETTTVDIVTDETDELNLSKETMRTTDKTERTDEVNLTQETTNDPEILTDGLSNTYSKTEEPTIELTSQATGRVSVEATMPEKTVMKTEIIDLTKDTIKESRLTTTLLPSIYYQTEETSTNETVSEVTGQTMQRLDMEVTSVGTETNNTHETDEDNLIEQIIKETGTQTTGIMAREIDSEVTEQSSGSILSEEITPGKTIEKPGTDSIDLSKDTDKKSEVSTTIWQDTAIATTTSNEMSFYDTNRATKIVETSQISTDKTIENTQEIEIVDVTKYTKTKQTELTTVSLFSSQTEEPSTGVTISNAIGYKAPEQTKISNTEESVTRATIKSDSTVIPQATSISDETKPSTVSFTYFNNIRQKSTSNKTEPSTVSFTDLITKISTSVMPMKPLCPVTSDQGQLCTKEGCYRYNNSCTLYYECYYSEPCGRIIASDIKKCPKCLKFNAQRKACDIAENVPECTYYRQSHPSHLKKKRPSQNRICTGPGKFVVPENRARYYDCTNKSSKNEYLLTVKRCPRNEEFDDVTKYCKRKRRCGMEMGCSRFHNVASACEKNRYAYDRYDCQKFYHCHHGVPTVPLFCPSEYIFNGKFCQSEKHSFVDHCNIE